MTEVVAEIVRASAKAGYLKGFVEGLEFLKPELTDEQSDGAIRFFTVRKHGAADEIVEELHQAQAKSARSTA